MIGTNDHAPDFGNSSFSFDVSENSAPGIVAYVSATDEDLGKNGQVTYRITSGDGKDLFDIDPEVCLMLGRNVKEARRQISVHVLDINLHFL